MPTFCVKLRKKYGKKLILTDKDIEFLIKRPYNESLVRDMQAHDRLLKVFSSGQNKHLLIDNYACLFDPSLWQTIHSHFEIHSVEILAQDSGSIFTHFNKVFQTQDGAKNDYNFSDLAEYADWLTYSKTCFLPRNPNITPFIGKSNTTFFQNNALRNAIYNPNDRIVIDLPNIPMELASPYVTIIPVDTIFDLQEDEHGTKYLITKIKEKVNQFDRNSKTITKYYIYDDEKVSVWVSENYITPTKENDYFHSFGVCPIIASSNLLRYANCHEYKKSVITDAFADLYDYNLLKNCIKHHVWQTAVPATLMIGDVCNGWDDGEGHWSCENGTLILTEPLHNHDSIQGDNAISNPKRKACHVCESKAKKKFNYGKTVELPHEAIFGNQLGENAHPEIIELARKTLEPIQSDTNFIEATEKILQNKKIAIVETITGEAYNKADSKEAFNIEQIKVSSDGKIQTLSTFATNLETRQTWVETMLCKIRYETFLNLQIYYGRGYFFEDEKTMYEMIALLNNVGSNISLKNEYFLKIAAKQYAKDDFGFELHKYLTSIIPYSDLTTAEFLALYPTMWALGKETQLDCLVRLHSLEWLNEFKMTGEEARIMGSYFVPVTKARKIKEWFYAKAENKLASLKPPEMPLEQTTEPIGTQENDDTPEPDNGEDEETEESDPLISELQNANN